MIGNQVHLTCTLVSVADCPLSIDCILFTCLTCTMTSSGSPGLGLCPHLSCGSRNPGRRPFSEHLFCAMPWAFWGCATDPSEAQGPQSCLWPLVTGAQRWGPLSLTACIHEQNGEGYKRLLASLLIFRLLSRPLFGFSALSSMV